MINTLGEDFSACMRPLASGLGQSRLRKVEARASSEYCCQTLCPVDSCVSQIQFRMDLKKPSPLSSYLMLLGSRLLGPYFGVQMLPFRRKHMSLSAWKPIFQRLVVACSVPYDEHDKMLLRVLQSFRSNVESPPGCPVDQPKPGHLWEEFPVRPLYCCGGTSFHYTRGLWFFRFLFLFLIPCLVLNAHITL